MKSYFYSVLLTCLFWTVENICGNSVSAQGILWKE